MEGCQQCSGLASWFCICGNAQVRLCEKCVSVHAGGDHSIFSLDLVDVVKTKEDAISHLEQRRTKQFLEEKVKKVTEIEETEMRETVSAVDQAELEIRAIIDRTFADIRQGLQENHSNFQGLLLPFRAASTSSQVQYADSRLNLLLSQPSLISFKFRKASSSSLVSELTRLLPFQDSSQSLVAGFNCIPILINSTLSKFSLPKCTSPEKNPLSVPTEINSGSVYCLFPDARLFVCGGEWHAEVYLIDPFTNAVDQLPKMISGRGQHGLVLHHKTVFVFGGSSGKQLLNLCEKFEIDSQVWRPLPKMIYNRHGITPCEIRGKVYIAGGGANTIEAFDIERETFESLPATLPGIKWTTCLNLGGDLVLLHTGKLLRCDLQSDQLKLVEVGELGLMSWWSSLQPIESKGKMYFLHPYNANREIYSIRKRDMMIMKVAVCSA